MDFYQSIVSAYDEIFPLNRAQIAFIESLYPVVAGKNILDAGCGTGSLAIELGRRGARVKAFDLDSDMILRAREKCPQALNVEFDEGDLLQIEDKYRKDSFDLIYCLGNTVVHLSDYDDVERFIQSSGSLLNDTGVLLLQIVNYDRIAIEDVKTLPTLSGSNYQFERFYKKTEEGKIAFSTCLTNIKTGEKNEQTVDLLPILKDKMISMLRPYFSEISVYGSFKSDDWNVGAFHTIVKAKV